MTVEDELHLLLGRLVHAFSRLDLCIGLQLKRFAPYLGASVEHLLSPQVPFVHRLRALKPLALAVYGDGDAALRSKLESWFVRADEAKGLRNDYAHGRWGTLPTGTSDGPLVEFIALSWDMDPKTQAPAISMLLSEFAEQVRTVESLFSEYMRLDRCYLDRHRSSVDEGPASGGSRTT